jgi:hypothetical protein
MGAKEKAEDLVDKFYQTTPNEYFVNEPIGIKGRYKSWEQAKQCALIAVDEILNTHLLSEKDIFGIHPVDYWQEVKQEIENL